MIRPATPKDAESIAAIHVHSWQETYRGILPDPLLDGLSVGVRSSQWYKLLITPQGPLVFVDEDKGTLTGFIAGAERREKLLTQDAEISALYVARKAQRKGIGTALMQQLAIGLRERDLNSLCLWVLDGNEGARKFYEALGGALIGERKENLGGHDFTERAYGWDRLDELAAE